MNEWYLFFRRAVCDVKIPILAAQKELKLDEAFPHSTFRYIRTLIGKAIKLSPTKINM